MGKVYRPRGACRDLFSCRDPEILIEGPAGTGKTRAVLEKLHLVGMKYPGCRMLMIRKTRTSLNTSGRVTFDNKVKVPAVTWEASKDHYLFPTGSLIVCGGMDKASRILSTEYDIIYVQEATELESDEWETLTTRLRNYRLPYQQMIGDCNPSSTTHWLLRRHSQGVVTRLFSKHKDNPLLYDSKTDAWTREGLEYIAKLSRLTGHTKERLLNGIWASASGMVYPEWDGSMLIDPFELPKSWPRYYAVDFGYTNPFVCQWWAVAPDDTMYMYRQLYQTERTVRAHAKVIHEYTELDGLDSRPRAICDHDAEDRATLEECGIKTVPAKKAVSLGIENTKFRLVEGRIRIFKGSLIGRDLALEESGVPTTTEEEFGAYIWDSARDKPVGKHDHGMDAMRYMVMHLDKGTPRRTVKSLRNN